MSQLGTLIRTDEVALTTDLLINALDYGVVGNDVADDTVALQAAMDAAATSGQMLYIPPGTYKITSALTYNAVKSGNIVFGAGEGATTVKQYTAAAHGLVYSATGDLGGFHLADISFVGPDGTGNGVQIAAHANTNARLRFHNVLSKQWNYAINLLDVDQCNFTCCNFRESVTGVHIDESLSVVNAVSFENCIVNDNTQYGFHIEGGRGITIDSCDIGSGSTAGINLILWAGQKGVVRGCNLEIQAGNTLTWGLHCDNAGSQLTVESCFFNGFSTESVVPIKVESSSSLTSLFNTHAMAAGTPLISGSITDLQVKGFGALSARVQTAVNANTIDTGTEVLQITPFPIIANTTTFTPSLHNRLAMVWKAGNNWSSSDDLQASIERTNGAGVATYHKSSLLNDNIIQDLEAWVASNPVVAASTLSTVATALEALQTKIGTMGL